MPSKSKPAAPELNADERREAAKQEAEAAPMGLQIIEMKVENIKRVVVAHIKPKRHVVLVTGKNGSGKSSVLDAITWALTGTGTVPSQPIRAGQRTGSVKIDLGDIVVTRHFTRVDPEKSKEGATYTTKLMVHGKRREEFPSPQLLLNKLMGKISFDPLAFTRMGDAEQLATLRGMVKLDVDIDAIDRDLRRGKAGEEPSLYDQRTDAGREVDSLKARLAGMAKPAADLPASAIDTAALTAKLASAAEHNGTVRRAVENQGALFKAAAQMQLESDKKREQIQLLKAEIIKLEIEAVQLETDSLEASHRAESAVIPKLVDTAEVAAELTRAQATNEAIQRAKAYTDTEAQLAEAEAKHSSLDEQMKARAKERADAVARAEMPIAGLGIGAGEVTFNGLPFGQCSSAEQIQVSMALAMASNPKLRVLRILDGSLLDDDSLELIADAAEQHGFQVWIERVDTSGKVGVVMEAGEASGEEVVEEAAK